MVIRALTPILLGTFLTLITAWALGRVVLRSLGVRLCRLEEDLFAFLAGSACLSAIVFVLCSVHLARKGVFIAVGVAAIGTAYWLGALRPAPDRLPRLSKVWLLLFAVPFAVYTVLYFFNALAPESSPDGSAYHLGNVNRWWSDRGFVRYTGSMFANGPPGLEMLFLVAFSVGRHSAAALVHFTFLMALPWLMLCYGRRFGMARPFVLGGVLVYLSPVAGVTGTSAYNDLALACVLFGLFYILQIWDASRNDRLLWVAGLLGAFGCTLRYTAVLGVVFSVAFVGWTLLRTRKPAWRAVAILVFCAAISMAPWLVKNWLWVGNPFSPFLNSWFPNPYVHVWSETKYLKSLRPYSAINKAKALPVLWSLSGAEREGLFGPWLLLTPLGLLALRWKQGRRLLFAAALFALPSLANNAARMMLPFAVFAAPALGLAVQNSPGVIPLLLLLHSLVSWPGAVAAYADLRAWRITNMPVRAALRTTPEDEYLQAKLDGYAMARTIDRITPSDARVLTLCRVPQAYTTRRLWNCSESAEGELAFQVLLSAAQAGERPRYAVRFRLPKGAVKALRVVQTSEKNELWSVSEMRLYRDGAEIPRQTSWRVSAKPNWWEAARAFDGNEVTAWSTWQAIEPGMYLEEDFDDTLPVDTVVLVSPHGQQAPTLRVDGLSTDGHWRPLAGPPEISELPVRTGLRQAAKVELKALGFHYVVARCDAEAAMDMNDNRSRGIPWNREIGGACIYPLD